MFQDFGHIKNILSKTKKAPFCKGAITVHIIYASKNEYEQSRILTVNTYPTFLWNSLNTLTRC